MIRPTVSKVRLSRRTAPKVTQAQLRPTRRAPSSTPVSTLSQLWPTKLSAAKFSPPRSLKATSNGSHVQVNLGGVLQAAEAYLSHITKNNTLSSLLGKTNRTPSTSRSPAGGQGGSWSFFTSKKIGGAVVAATLASRFSIGGLLAGSIFWWLIMMMLDDGM